MKRLSPPVSEDSDEDDDSELLPLTGSPVCCEQRKAKKSRHRHFALRVTYKIYTTYFYATSFLFMFCCGMTGLLSIVYTLLLPGIQGQKSYPVVGCAVLAQLLTESYFWASWMSLQIKTARDLWWKDSHHSRRLIQQSINFVHKFIKGEKLVLSDPKLQRILWFVHILFLVCIPLGVALISLYDGSLSYAYSLFIVTATLSTALLLICKWVAIWAVAVKEKYNLLRTYKLNQLASTEEVLYGFGIDHTTIASSCLVISVFYLMFGLFFGFFLGRYVLLGMFLPFSFLLLIIAVLHVGEINLQRGGKTYTFRGLCQSRPRLTFAILAVSYVLWLVFSVVCLYIVSWENGLLYIGLLVATQGGLQRKSNYVGEYWHKKKVKTGLSNTMLILFVVVYFVLSFGLAGFGQNISNAETSAEPISHFTVRPIVPSESSYDICRERWQDSSYTIIDMAYFSKLAYASNNTFDEEFKMWFGHRKHLRVITRAYGNTSVWYTEFHDTLMNSSVIAVRGTASGVDVLQDAQVWGTIFIFQIASALGPFLSLWPETCIRMFVWLFYVLKREVFRTKFEYLYPLRSYVSEVKHRVKHVVLTGHSLGGGLANLVGSDMEVQSITFSAPGIRLASIGYSAAHHIDNNVNHYTLNIVPNRDIVPQIDEQGGVIEHIDCDHFALNCHYLTNTLCELLRSCGDPTTHDDMPHPNVAYLNRTLKGCDIAGDPPVPSTPPSAPAAPSSTSSSPSPPVPSSSAPSQPAEAAPSQQM